MIYGYKYNTGCIKLKMAMAEKNVMQCFMADELGITVQTFNRKINRNSAYFTKGEQMVIRNYLNNWDKDLFAYKQSNGKLVVPVDYYKK